jgi:hypothetical protein
MDTFQSNTSVEQFLVLERRDDLCFFELDNTALLISLLRKDRYMHLCQGLVEVNAGVDHLLALVQVDHQLDDNVDDLG